MVGAVMLVIAAVYLLIQQVRSTEPDPPTANVGNEGQVEVVAAEGDGRWQRGHLRQY